MLFVLSRGLLGAIVGAVFGFLLTAVNNEILVHQIGAAHGSYRWWIKFGMFLFAILFLLGAILWKVATMIFKK